MLDGWWAEAYDGANGWALAGEVDEDDPGAQDARDSAELYRLLEEEVVPCFYERDADGIPRAWLARVRASLRSLPHAFGAGRMLDEYKRRVYPLPAPDEEVTIPPRGSRSDRLVSAERDRGRGRVSRTRPDPSR